MAFRDKIEFVYYYGELKLIQGFAHDFLPFSSILTMASTYRQELVDQFGFEPPQGYLAYLLAAESIYDFGAAYLIEADELTQYNTDYEATDRFSGYFLIGTQDGEALAIEKATGYFVQTPFIGHDEETPIILGIRWSEFLEYLQSGNL
jgi:hypothetical protein